MTLHDALGGAALATILAPLTAFLVLLLTAGAGLRPSERVIGAIARAAFFVECMASVLATALFVHVGERAAHFTLPAWFVTGGYAFELGLAIDAYALGFLVVVGVVSALVGSVSHRYLHREEGYRRFFLLLLLCATGMPIIVLADGLDLLFVGWEIVGISSALLIGFYQERPSPARHGLLAFAVYRTCDVGLLAGIVLLHGFAGHGELPGPGASTLTVAHATVLGLLFLFGAMGKSGQLPFTGWLPRAMEGPTTSSAIFYGALSVHAGAYLLVRTAPIWSGAPLVHTAIVLVGAATALNGSIVGRVQTDAKTAIAYATVAQVGVIFVEIGFGLDAVAIAHIAGNAILRSFQILRAPSVIAEHERVENALGGVRPRAGVHLELLLPEGARRWLYRYALERGYIDALAYSAAGAARSWLGALDRFDHRLAEAIALQPSPSVILPAPPDEHALSSSSDGSNREVAR